MRSNHIKITDLPEHYQKKVSEILEKSDNRNTGSIADKKRAVRSKSLAEETFTRFDRPVDIICSTTRRRQTDHRAVEDKYFTDALVTCGVLQDDKKKYVTRLDVPEPTIGIDERTIIQIEETQQ